MALEFKDWVSLIAILISVVSLFFSIYDKKIKLSAQLQSDEQGYNIEIYNNSNRQVTISYFQIFKARFKRLSKKQFATTWYDDGYSSKFVIPSHHSDNLEFKEAYSLNGFIQNRKGKHIYITLFVSGKKAKIIKLT